MHCCDGEHEPDPRAMTIPRPLRMQFRATAIALCGISTIVQRAEKRNSGPNAAS